MLNWIAADELPVEEVVALIRRLSIGAEEDDPFE
jgi:hypothetical protein